MKSLHFRIPIAMLTFMLATSLPALATDVDGPNDCQRVLRDFGDAPEGVLAYPGVIGKFPTCLLPGPIGTQEIACVPPISTFPGPAGFVMHISPDGSINYWLGCTATGGPMGIDSEPDAKMNDTGGPVSACATSVVVDCVETAFGMSFGQDECYGSTDAGIASPLTFLTCTSSSFTFSTYSCASTVRQVYLNVLVDMNEDGDWNDNYQCNAGACAYEWAVKNALILLPPGCSSQPTPSFLMGPNAGRGWLRISISDNPMPDDFPWNGTAGLAGQAARMGETEDYPVTIQSPDPCPGYLDFGDAPEEIQAYPGVSGHFPTCIFPSTPGNRTVDCLPISSAPGVTGYVEHRRVVGDALGFWLGCGAPALGLYGVDSEINGKTNDTGAPVSVCDPAVPIDCVEAAFGMFFGQDECYGDADAGITAPITFDACSMGTVDFKAFNCKNTVDAFLNILVDWNEDGDWNDNFKCPATGDCAYEWAVKNVAVTLPPGCTSLTSPAFRVGPRAGRGWLRITLTPVPVADDFPWNGSLSTPSGFFTAGETEDYPVNIRVHDPCQEGYRDFGDAPEEIPAYSSGIIGHFPTCLFPGAPGTQEIDCGIALSTLPGPTGFVMNLSLPTDPFHFWLGCARDGESDGKSSVIPPFGTRSACDTSIVVDCTEAAYGMVFGQDECTGDPDAGVSTTYYFPACSLSVVAYKAYNCATFNQPAYLNILVDWTHDGDWNDNVLCLGMKQCVPEWAVKNAPIALLPGCANYTSPPFRVGPKRGESWMRITISVDPAPDDFPWNGSAGIGPDQALHGGETEDYPAYVVPSTVDVTPPEHLEGLWMAPMRPNPSSRGTNAHFALPREAEVALEVYDVSGRKLADLAHGTLAAGEHIVPWNFRDASGAEVPVGVYVIHLRVGTEELTQRVIRIR